MLPRKSYIVRFPATSNNVDYTHFCNLFVIFFQIGATLGEGCDLIFLVAYFNWGIECDSQECIEMGNWWGNKIFVFTLIEILERFRDNFCSIVSKKLVTILKSSFVMKNLITWPEVWSLYFINVRTFRKKNIFQCSLVDYLYKLTFISSSWILLLLIVCFAYLQDGRTIRWYIREDQWICASLFFSSCYPLFKCC